MSDEPALEIGRRRNTDRSFIFYEHHIVPRLHELQRNLNVYRFRIGALVSVAIVLWFFYLLWVLADPVETLLRESVLERTLNIELLNVDKSALRRYESVHAFLVDAHVRLPCVEVPLEELQRGRTAAMATGGRRHHSLSNLRDLCRHVMQHEQLGFVTPKMTTAQSEACFLSIIIHESGGGGDDNTVDMVNPHEIDLGGDDDVASVQVQFRDLLFKDAPLVWVDSKPSLNLRYRQLNGETRVLKLTGSDAHMMRAALMLMHHGRPVSLWDMVMAPPPRYVEDEL